ncbi:MAG: hypothetical protein PUB20_05635 [Clostridia bacterium]|nr:hypothetical protein [Clostridia bacterium]
MSKIRQNLCRRLTTVVLAVFRPDWYLAIASAAIALVCVLLFKWIKEKGTKIFEAL